ncbi:MAG: hypothetical protein JWO78_1538 [Micavibrio sp.]|nr:hypothetical protein [Micavibrio sp.]
MERDAELLNDDDVSKVIAEHIRHALKELENHDALDALASVDTVPPLKSLRAGRQALERFSRAEIELAGLLKIMGESFYGNRPEDLSPLFYRVSRRDLDEVHVISENMDTVWRIAEQNLIRQENAFRERASRRGLHVVPKTP